MAEPPSIDLGEVTDKGSINQRAVLTHRAALVDALHDNASPEVIRPQHATATPSGVAVAATRTG